MVVVFKDLLLPLWSLFETWYWHLKGHLSAPDLPLWTFPWNNPKDGSSSHQSLPLQCSVWTRFFKKDKSGDIECRQCHNGQDKIINFIDPNRSCTTTTDKITTTIQTTYIFNLEYYQNNCTHLQYYRVWSWDLSEIW